MKSSVLEETILREPVDRGVRLVALSLIDDAQKASDKLTSLSKELRDGDTAADEALHDFRVAIRRLRSWVRAFKPWLLEDVSPKWRRRLAGIADKTRTTRDAAVHLKWLREERPALTARQRVGQTWLSDRLEVQRSKGAEEALSAAADFAQTVPKLTRRLDSFRAPVREPDRTARFGAVFADRVTKESEALRRRLSDIHDFSDVKRAHRARIAAKRLRYILEPASNLLLDGDAIITTLKTLQDSLGDLHDVHVFAEELVGATEQAAGSRARRVSEVVLADDEEDSEDDRVRRARARDPGPGLLGLARRLHDRGMTAYAELAQNWLNDGGAPFFERVRNVAADLKTRALHGSEVEHKYLLKRLPVTAVDAPSVEIEQGPQLGDKLVERVRRYSIRESDDLVWEVDEFLDRELVLAEIELPTPDTSFELPGWLRDVLDREVTDDPDYSEVQR
jgi:CHAD domain-containing protein